MDWHNVASDLSQKLNPVHVKPAPAGKYGDYIEGWHAISEANRIFGFDGWSYSVDRVQLTNATDDNGKHRIGYFAQVTVTVDGRVSRSDVGHGQGFGKSEGDAHDSAVKEAVTDAIKRALRSFGNPFGLALYDKSKANVGTPRDARQIADALISAAKKAGTWAQLKGLIEGDKYKDALSWLVKEKPPMANEVTAAVTERQRQLDPAMQAPDGVYNDA